MAATRTHDIITVIASGCVVGLSAITQDARTLRIGFGVFLGLLFSPDWDWNGWLVEHKDTKRRYVLLERGPREHERRIRRVYSVVIRRWPPPLRWWLYVYALIFKHRGVSHHPLFGTLTRLIWLVFPLFLIIVNRDILGVWIGVWFSDLLHILADR